MVRMLHALPDLTLAVFKCAKSGFLVTDLFLLLCVTFCMIQPFNLPMTGTMMRLAITTAGRYHLFRFHRQCSAVVRRDK